MIVIIADDFSGAAELAGIAASRGFKAEVQTEFDRRTEAEVVAVDTDTRLLGEAEAVRKVGNVAQQVVAAAPQWIYKKTDSVLRGHIRAEIGAILAATGQGSSLFIPANPSKDRVIISGRYFANGMPLDETVFATDPDYPRQSAVVADLLGNAPAIRVPDVQSLADIEQEATGLPDQVLPAGAADFFTALIGGKPRESQRLPISCTLFVCGSLAAWQTSRAEQMRAVGFEVMALPEACFRNGVDEAWVSKVRETLQRTRRVMIAIGQPADSHPPAALTNTLVDAAARIIAGVSNLRVAIEGGATAMAFIRLAGWTRFSVVPEGITGVGSLRPAGMKDAPLLWVKPGSYPWPEGVFA